MGLLGVITAMEAEASLLMENMEGCRAEKQGALTFYRGRLRGREAVLGLCSVGKVNGALGAAALLNKYRPDCLLHSGIAGSLTGALPPLSFAVGESFTYYDVRPSQLKRFFPFQQYFFADKTLTGLLYEAALPLAQSGLLLTGDDFIAGEEKRRRLLERFPKALSVDMESCAIAQAAFLSNTPFGALRCISDSADGAAAADYESFEKQAAALSARALLQVTEKL